MAFSPPNYTQIPNEFFDEIVKDLKEGELRVLIVIMRQTFGWHKDEDKISLSQLERKTGMCRRRVSASVKSLIELGLVIKRKEGKNGLQFCYYSINTQKPKIQNDIPDEGTEPENDDIPDSNNFYQWPKATGGLRLPTKETPKRNIKKEEEEKEEEDRSTAKRSRSAAPPIKLNLEKNCWEGISAQDIKDWKNTFTAISVEKELEEAKLWAKTVVRKNYRRSLNSWMSNANKNHITPFKQENRETKTGSPEDFEKNKSQAQLWEKIQFEKKTPHYWIDALSNSVVFGMPENGYEVSYNLENKEFNIKCEMALKRMCIKND